VDPATTATVVPGTLPETGSETGVVALGLALLAVGATALAVVARSRAADEPA
jgi:LPXTG-motif cell wall-anchored protein